MIGDRPWLEHWRAVDTTRGKVLQLGRSRDGDRPEVICGVAIEGNDLVAAHRAIIEWRRFNP